jgi:hypothetical protein
MPLDLAKFQGAPPVGSPAIASKVATDLKVASTPDGAEISVDGNFVGNAPFNDQRISSNLKDSTKQFGWLQAPATKNIFPVSDFRTPQPFELTILHLAEESTSLRVFAYSSKLY